MQATTENNHAGEHILSEPNGQRGRDEIIVAVGNNLKAGAVLGQIVGGSATASADTDNTGDGTIGSVSTGAGVKEGTYVATFVEEATDGGDFVVEDPAGENVGSGSVGAAFSGGGIQFTISDGSTDFVAGDRFIIEVSGSGEYAEFDPAATNGAGTPAAILYDAVDASAGAERAAATTADSEVDGQRLVWKDGISEQEKAAAIRQLDRGPGIRVR